MGGAGHPAAQPVFPPRHAARDDRRRGRPLRRKPRHLGGGKPQLLRQPRPHARDLCQRALRRGAGGRGASMRPALGGRRLRHTGERSHRFHRGLPRGRGGRVLRRDDGEPPAADGVAVRGIRSRSRRRHPPLRRDRQNLSEILLDHPEAWEDFRSALRAARTQENPS